LEDDVELQHLVDFECRGRLLEAPEARCGTGDPVGGRQERGEAIDALFVGLRCCRHSTTYVNGFEFGSGHRSASRIPDYSRHLCGVCLSEDLYMKERKADKSQQ